MPIIDNSTNDFLKWLPDQNWYKITQIQLFQDRTKGLNPIRNCAGSRLASCGTTSILSCLQNLTQAMCGKDVFWSCFALALHLQYMKLLGCNRQIHLATCPCQSK